MRTSSRPSVCRARPMFSVEVRIRVARKSLSQVSTASQRSSRGVRFQRSQLRQTTQRRPFAGSKARRRPTGKASTTSLEPRGSLQNMQVRYIASQMVGVLQDGRVAEPRPVGWPWAGRAWRQWATGREERGKGKRSTRRDRKNQLLAEAWEPGCLSDLTRSAAQASVENRRSTPATRPYPLPHPTASPGPSGESRLDR